MAVDIFFKLGDKIKGESIDDGKDGKDAALKDQIDILSWSWSASYSGSFQTGSGGGAGKANIGDLSLQKYTDKSTNDIVKHLVSGEHIPTGLLSVRKAGGAKPLVYYFMELEDIIISSYNIGGSVGSDDRPVESISLNFARYRITYTIQDNKGAAAGKTSAGWDIPKNKTW